MKSYEQLKIEYDEALFALLMDNVILEEGNALLAENERLKENPEFVITPEMDRRMLSTIDKAFNKKTRKNIGNRTKFCRKCVAAALVLVCITSAICGISPTVRASLVELAVRVSQTATSLFVGENEELYEGVDRVYSVGWIPEGFNLYSEFVQGSFEIYKYTRQDGALISIQFTYGEEDLISNVDTEDADVVEQIEINGHDGLLIEKNGRIHIALVDVSKGNFVDVVCIGVDRDTVISIVQSINMKK